MWVRCLRFALLVLISGVLHAKTAEQPCSAPILTTGYFLPLEQSYSHQTSIYYACDNKHKPVGEGWWATSTCQNGKWIHEPQCIDENFCLPLNIPNAKNPKNSVGWYAGVHKLKIKCNDGYTSENNVTNMECVEGTWSEGPVCKQSITACGEPPYYPNAVINNHKYQEVFAENSKVRYQCKDGYATEDQTTVKSVTCKNGAWTEGPKCRHSPTSSGSEDPETSPSFTTIDKCGEFPVVADGVVKQDDVRSLHYECARYYKLVGSSEVVCYSGGTWSEAPTCKANYCSLNTADYDDLINRGLAYLTNGETKTLDCKDKWNFRNFALVVCSNRIPTISKCCNRVQINTGFCWSQGLMTD